MDVIENYKTVFVSELQITKHPLSGYTVS